MCVFCLCTFVRAFRVRPSHFRERAAQPFANYRFKTKKPFVVELLVEMKRFLLEITNKTTKPQTSTKPTISERKCHDICVTRIFLFFFYFINFSREMKEATSRGRSPVIFYSVLSWWGRGQQKLEFYGDTLSTATV